MIEVEEITFILLLFDIKKKRVRFFSVNIYIYNNVYIYTTQKIWHDDLKYKEYPILY